MKRKIFILCTLALLVAGAIFYACQKDQVMTNPDEGLMLKAGITGEFEWDDPVCVNDPHEFCLTYEPKLNPQGKPLNTQLQVQIWDEAEDEYVQIFNYGATDEGTVCFDYTFLAPGTYYLRYKIGDGGFSDDVEVTVIVCGDCDWVKVADETAWAKGDPYNVDGGGNWAMYVPYEGNETDSILLAGQTIEIGNVHFSTPVDGDVTITITLIDDEYDISWRFADDDENVKIQDYETAPSGNPAPGQFDWKDGADIALKTFSIVVDENNFYGVHVDVEKWICVEPE